MAHGPWATGTEISPSSSSFLPGTEVSVPEQHVTWAAPKIRLKNENDNPLMGTAFACSFTFRLLSLDIQICYTTV